MKCFLCGGLLTHPAYRKLYHPYNVPTHSDKDMSECVNNMILRRFETFLTNAKRLRMIGLVAPFSHIILTQEDDMHIISSLLFLSEDDWKKELSERMPEQEIVRPEKFVEYPVTLEKHVWNQLVDQELFTTQGGEDAYKLKNVITDVYEKMQKGEMPLEHPYYQQPLTWSLTDKLQERFVLIPEEFLQMDFVVLNADTWLARLLKIYSENLKPMKRTSIKAKTLSFANSIYDFPGNKREALQKALSKYPRNREAVLDNIPVAKYPRSSIRLYEAEYSRLEKISKKEHESMYRLIPALIKTEIS